MNRKRRKTQIAIFLSVAMLLSGMGVMRAAATEGQVRRSDPPWLSLFGAAVTPDGSGKVAAEPCAARLRSGAIGAGLSTSAAALPGEVDKWMWTTC